MANKILPSLCLSLILFSLNTFAAPLWLNTSTGMTMDQVRHVFPTLTKSVVTSATINDKPVQQLKLENIRIDENTFTGVFSFHDNKLFQVKLELDAVSLGSTNMVFATLTDALRKKYGKERDYSEKTGLINQRRAEWVFHGTKIILMMESFSSENATLELMYRAFS